MTDALVLASASPRRHVLLDMLGIVHEVKPVEIEEIRNPSEPPERYAARLASEKAHAAATLNPGRWVLGADTIVIHDGEVLEKPKTEAVAVEMLRSLAGSTHRVVSAVTLVGPGGDFSDVDITSVRFRSLTDKLILDYVATGEPMDKAGAYGIQGKGAVLVESIDGDYFGVMGLPVVRVVKLLERAGRPYHFTR